MRLRCSNQNRADYHRYGGRGIGVCHEWKQSFESFLAHVGPAPSPQHSIDRIDNDGNYEPGNVRWATTSQQSRNRSTNVYVVTADRETLILKDAAEGIGVTQQALRQRVTRCGWSWAQAVACKGSARKEKPACRRGHDMTGDNVYVRPGDSGRACVICRLISSKNRAVRSTKCANGHPRIDNERSATGRRKRCQVCRALSDASASSRRQKKVAATKTF